jgi:hypothetical protein
MLGSSANGPRPVPERGLRGSEHLAQSVRDGLRQPGSLPSLGLELVSLALLAIKPTPDTARALEAKAREQILKEADDALYLRRNAAIDQERAVKENELNTEIAVEAKKRQIREAQMDAERAVLDKRLQIQAQEMQGRIAHEKGVFADQCGCSLAFSGRAGRKLAMILSLRYASSR